MVKYKIYTEDMNRKSIEETIADFFDGFTIYSAVGYWKGTQEKSLVIEILGNNEDKLNVYWIADLIKKSNKQESVLVTTEYVESSFV